MRLLRFMIQLRIDPEVFYILNTRDSLNQCRCVEQKRGNPIIIRVVDFRSFSEIDFDGLDAHTFPVNIQVKLCL